MSQTNAQLQRKAKQGWKCYFTLVKEHEQFRDRTVAQYDLLRQRLQRNEEVDIVYLTEQFLQMYEQISNLINCPVCLEPMTRDQIHLPFCGHMICKGCKATGNLVRCVICRKLYA